MNDIIETSTPSSIRSISPLLQQEKRIKWVDAAKALGVLLVFWGHMLYAGSQDVMVVNRAIYSFHMPLFFILSGYVINLKRSTFKDYVIEKFKKILLPALLLYVITLPIYFTPHYIDYGTTTINSVLITIFYIYGSCAYNSPIWFFICMFQVLLIIKLLNLPNSNINKIFLVAFVCVILSFLFYQSELKIFKLFGTDKCLLGTFFFTIGMLLRRSNYHCYISSIGIILFPIWILSGIIYNDKVSMYGMGLGHFWLFVVSGITGTLVFIAFSRLFEKNKRLCSYASWTIFIVGSHFLLVTPFHALTGIFSLKGTHFIDIISFIYVILSLYLYGYLCKYLEKRLPVLFGK